MTTIMTIDEVLELVKKDKRRKTKEKRSYSDEEHLIQCECVRAFRYKYPKLRHNLFAIPNGARRDKATGSKLKAEGVLAGVSDLIFLKPNRFYGALLIEMKTPKGRQQETQKEWERKITADGYKYVVCRSVSEFMQEIDDYLKDV